MDKAAYEELVIEVVEFDVEDVIGISGDDQNELS